MHNILIAGVGGQGTLLSSRLLGYVALKEDLDVKMSEVHGMAQRGGSVVTHVKMGERVYSPLVEPGEAHVLLAFERLEALRSLHYVRPEGMVIVNDQVLKPMPVIMGAAEYPEGIFERIEEVTRELKRVDALSMAKEIGNVKTVNTILLGLLARSLPFSKENWEEAIEETVPPKTVSMNKKAFYRGWSL